MLAVTLTIAALYSLGLIVVAAWFYGSLLPRERSVSRSVQVNAAPELVYDLAIDAQGQASWRSDVSDISMGEGGKGWVEHTRHGDVSFEIVDEDRPHAFSLRYAGERGFKGNWTGSFTAGASGTEVTLTETVTVEPPFPRLLSHVMKFTERFMDRYIRELKAEAERRHDQGPLPASGDDARQP